MLFAQNQESGDEKRKTQGEVPECRLSSEAWAYTEYHDIYVELIRKILHQAGCPYL